MANIVLYTKTTCIFCKLAKELLTNKNQNFIEIVIDNDPSLREEMIAKSGRQTVPQIFINGHSIGGYDDISAMDETGKLDKLLQG